MEHEILPYNKYGEWECGRWVPYEDMEELHE